MGATTAVLAGRPTPDAVTTLLREHRPTIFHGVPTLYGGMLAQPSGEGEGGSTRGRDSRTAGRGLPPVNGTGGGSASGQDGARPPDDEPSSGEGGPARVQDDRRAPEDGSPPGRERGDGSSRLRLAVSAGEALPAEIGAAREARFGAPVLGGLGSTEMLHIFLSNREGDVRYGTSGKAVPGHALKVVTESGEPAAAGEIGELWVSGGSSAVAYDHHVAGGSPARRTTLRRAVRAAGTSACTGRRRPFLAVVTPARGAASIAPSSRAGARASGRSSRARRPC